MEQANAEIGRELHQVTSILMDSLVWIFADFTGAGKAKRAPGHEPLIEEIMREPVA